LKTCQVDLHAQRQHVIYHAKLAARDLELIVFPYF
jgi:hypothetical protein